MSNIGSIQKTIASVIKPNTTSPYTEFPTYVGEWPLISNMLQLTRDNPELYTETVHIVHHIEIIVCMFCSAEPAYFPNALVTPSNWNNDRNIQNAEDIANDWYRKNRARNWANKKMLWISSVIDHSISRSSVVHQGSSNSIAFLFYLGNWEKNLW